jgi:hypothetical protein
MTNCSASPRRSPPVINDKPGEIARFNHERVKNTWYLPFFQLLTENVRKENMNTVFDNVSFVIFNYDRCIEHYSYHAIKGSAGVNVETGLSCSTMFCEYWRALSRRG